MSWEKEVQEIDRRRRLAVQMGGKEAVALQHERGRHTVRERIELLADPGSWRETGPIAGHAEIGPDGELVAFRPANYVLGFARVDGRPCVVGGEDFTQKGGSPSPAGLRKSVYAEDLAIENRVPLIRLLEGGGGSVAEASGKTGRRLGDPVYRRPRFASFAEVMATAPVISVALGAVAGFPRRPARGLTLLDHDAKDLAGADRGPSHRRAGAQPEAHQGRAWRPRGSSAKWSGRRAS